MQTQRHDAGVPWEWPPVVVEYRPSGSLCRWTVLLTWATAVLSVALAATSWWVALTPRPAGYEAAWFPIDTVGDAVDTTVTLLLWPVELAVPVVAVVWLWRVRENSTQMSAARHRRTRVWTWLS